MTIYLERDGELVEMTEKSYDAEDRLQKLIAAHPNLLAGAEERDRRDRWVLIQREVAVAGSSGWSRALEPGPPLR